MERQCIKAENCEANNISQEERIITFDLIYSNLRKITDRLDFIRVETNMEIVNTYSDYDSDIAYGFHVGEEYKSLKLREGYLEVVLLDRTELKIMPSDIFYMNKDEAYKLVITEIGKWASITNKLCTRIEKITHEFKLHDLKDTYELYNTCTTELNEIIDVNNKQEIDRVINGYIEKAYKSGKLTVQNVKARFNDSFKGICFEGCAESGEEKIYRIFPVISKKGEQ